jgi:hypothetical protein
MIVTRPLTELIEEARGGRVVAFRTDIDRFVPEWGELLGLGQARWRPYVTSGLVFLGAPVGTEVLALMEELRVRVDFDSTLWRKNVGEYPFLYADQDVLNAILSTRVPPDRVVALDHRLHAATPFDEGELRGLDEASLRCVYADGTEPYVLHHVLPAKPWLRPIYHGLYSRLLRRLLIGSDVAVRVPRGLIPLRMRTGCLARAERARVGAGVKLRWHAGIALHRIRTRLPSFSDRRAVREP